MACNPDGRGWTRDGHKLIVSLGPDYTLDVDVMCIGDCHLWDADHKPEGADDCWLRETVNQFGSEFLEWWSGTENTTPVQINGPIEIEWRHDGEEMFWQPVVKEGEM
jgi:hypothetical protein